MSWIPLPKTKQQREPFRLLGSFPTSLRDRYQRTRNSRLDHSRFYKLVLDLFILVFALRVGTAVIPMFNGMGFTAAWYGDGILLPEAQVVARLDQPRLVMFITITRDGVVEFDGRKVEPKHWKEIMVRHKSIIPKTKALFLVDRECKMEVVMAVLQAAREAGIAEVIFATSRSGDRL